MLNLQCHCGVNLRNSNEDARSIIPKTLTRPVDTTQGCDYDNASRCGAGIVFSPVIFQRFKLHAASNTRASHGCDSNEDARSVIPKTLTRPVDTTQGCDVIRLRQRFPLWGWHRLFDCDLPTFQTSCGLEHGRQTMCAQWHLSFAVGARAAFIHGSTRSL